MFELTSGRVYRGKRKGPGQSHQGQEEEEEDLIRVTEKEWPEM